MPVVIIRGCKRPVVVGDVGASRLHYWNEKAAYEILDISVIFHIHGRIATNLYDAIVSFSKTTTGKDSHSRRRGSVHISPVATTSCCDVVGLGRADDCNRC